MKIKHTINPIALCLFIWAVAMLSSCSVSNHLSSSRDAHHHLNLVKADYRSLSTSANENKGIEPIINPISYQGILVPYQPDKQLNELLKTDVRLLTKETKRSFPLIYEQIKTININTALHQVIKNNSERSSNNKLSVNNTNSMVGHGYFGLFILFLLLAILFWILSVGTGIFGVLGLISSIAAVIFFILWIVSLAS